MEGTTVFSTRWADRGFSDKFIRGCQGTAEVVRMTSIDPDAAEETLELLASGALDDVLRAEWDIAHGKAVDADELMRLMRERVERELRG